MFKLNYFFYKDEEDKKISLDWFVYEDRWFNRFMFDKPRHDVASMELYRQWNLSRCKRFSIRLIILSLHIYLDIKLKKVGNMYYGRTIEDGPKPSPRKRREQQ